MVGANPKYRTYGRAGPATPSGAALPVQAQALRHRDGFQHWRLLVLLSALVPLSFVLLQCGQAPSAAIAAPRTRKLAAVSMVSLAPCRGLSAPQLRTPAGVGQQRARSGDRCDAAGRGRDGANALAPGRRETVCFAC